MIKAAVYLASKPKGVGLRPIPIPQLSGTVYAPNGGNIPKEIIMTLLSLFMSFITTVIAIIRVVCPGVPGPYGAYKDRHMILCKVIGL